MSTKTCCICQNEFTEYGNNPEPFDGEMGMCCDDCNNRFVIPVRLMFGRGASGQRAPLKMLTKLAATGAMIAKSSELAKRLWAERQAAKAGDNVTPIR